MNHTASQSNDPDLISTMLSIIREREAMEEEVEELEKKPGNGAETNSEQL
ncbi:MAG: hypothetical protein ACRD42_00975 [Nitrososphaeraceae archaeon]